jgi:hypothetical protein
VISVPGREERACVDLVDDHIDATLESLKESTPRSTIYRDTIAAPHDSYAIDEFLSRRSRVLARQQSDVVAPDRPALSDLVRKHFSSAGLGIPDVSPVQNEDRQRLHRSLFLSEGF